MRRLAGDAELAAAYGRAGRAYADLNLDRAKVAARFLALLREVAARSDQRTRARRQSAR